MTKFKTTLLAATVLALPIALQAPAAQAQPVSGLYVAAGAGLNWMGNQTHSANSGLFEICDYGCVDVSVSGRGRTNARLGFVGVASIGWGFGNGLRAELEGSWRDNLFHGSLDTALNIYGESYAHTGSGHPIRGRSSQYAVMVNALYDMNIGVNWMYPYIGVGVGYSWQRFTGLGAEGSGHDDAIGDYYSEMSYRSNGTAGRFAYQAIAGAAFPIASVPGLSFTAEYRFMGTVGNSNLRVSGYAAGHTDDQNDYSENSRSFNRVRVTAPHNHSILLGLRYAFNAAPAAVMAPVVAPAGKSFLVFFDWDKSTLTDRARGIIREAAATSKTTQHTRVEVNGYADTSGNAKYNQGISMRRAQTVAAELVRNGVAKGEIAIKAFGDTVLLVPTGPGVREPQNRRVEIIIR